ncbi:MAG: conserved membrane protein of unknown function [Promethearchaeota archaeon]|nr:MAG: conserved membrane protein of unknown function [Candidatus Lokiarchaeota archaeon]
MKRFKSVDFFRGLSITYMIIGHLIEWWITEQDIFVFHMLRILFEFLGSGAFLLISGMSTIFSYRKRTNQYSEKDLLDKSFLKKEYFLRALLLLGVGLGYNIFVVVAFGEIKDLWTWFILITISFSLIITWPLLNTSKTVRISIGISVWILNYFLLSFLRPFDGQSNLYGVLFYILYHNLELDPLLQFFPFFIIGTVLGDLLVDIYEDEHIESKEKRLKALKKDFLIPCMFFGCVSVLIGILLEFPSFLSHRTAPWILYSLGLDLVFIAILVALEESAIFIKKKNYRFFYYFSYYSFTIYLAHNVLYFLFHRMLPAFILIPTVIGVVFIVWIILRAVYKRFGSDASLKYQLSRLATHFAENLQRKQILKLESIKEKT